MSLFKNMLGKDPEMRMIYDAGRVNFKVQILERQFRAAMKGSPAVLIHLGKVYCGQGTKVKLTMKEQPQGVIVTMPQPIDLTSNSGPTRYLPPSAEVTRGDEIMKRNPAEIMTALARQFPVLKKAPGIDPWEPALLDEWAASDRQSTGAKVVTRFLLTVWNDSTNYWKSGPFQLRDLGQLDDENLEAWKAWAARPFFL